MIAKGFLLAPLSGRLVRFSVRLFRGASLTYKHNRASWGAGYQAAAERAAAEPTTELAIAEAVAELPITDPTIVMRSHNRVYLEW